jgi:hypothetical protein
VLISYAAIGYGYERDLARFLLYIVSDENEPDRELGEERDWSSGVDGQCSLGFSCPGWVRSSWLGTDKRRDSQKGGGRNGYDSSQEIEAHSPQTSSIPSAAGVADRDPRRVASFVVQSHPYGSPILTRRMGLTSSLTLSECSGQASQLQAHFYSDFFARQQKPVRLRIARRIPIMVSRIGAQETVHHAKTITKIARMNLQKHHFMFTSFFSGTNARHNIEK